MAVGAVPLRIRCLESNRNAERRSAACRRCLFVVRLAS